MKLTTVNSIAEREFSGADYLHLSKAVGVIEVQVYLQNGTDYKTEMVQGATIKPGNISKAIFTSKTGDQTLEVFSGKGDYTPPVSATLSTAIQSITEAISVQRVIEGVKIAAAQEIAVNNLPENQLVTVDNFPALQPVSVKTATGVTEVQHTIPVLGVVTIPANANRKRIHLQNHSEDLTFCRVSSAAAVAPAGLYLIGGGGNLGEKELETTASLKIWNTSDTNQATVIVLEEAA